MWQLGYPLVIAHLNHGLRSEAEEDALAVRKAAQSRGLPFVLKLVEIPAYARIHALSIEEAARKVRYQFLFEQARQYQAQAVAVAHTADDQVETVLMHLLRGAGLTGLKGMNYRIQPNPWSDEIALIRPLLGVFRDQVLNYCSKLDLHPVFDRSNLDTTFFRNRIRGELLPALETYNSGIKSGLWRMAQTLACDDQVLEKLTSDAWQDCCLVIGAGSVALKAGNILAQPLGIQRRLVRRAISILRPGLRDIDFATIERTLSLMQHLTHGGQSDLANGLCLVREGEKLWIANWDDDLPISDWPQLGKLSHELPIPGVIDLLRGWYIQAEPVVDIHEAFTQATNNTDPFQAWIDIRDSKASFTIRSPSAGDRFHPLGMNGHSIKLSDFFINVKMPRRLRSRWPLVCLGNGVAWIPGYRLAHSHRLTLGSTQAVFIQVLKA
jgi:tRNA(Ile)-lysidine synthase